MIDDTEMATLRIRALSHMGPLDPETLPAQLAYATKIARWLSIGEVPGEVIPARAGVALPDGGIIQHARKLGAKPPKRDDRVPRLSTIAPSLPAAPPRHTAYIEAVASWELGENDRLGTCTCVCPANVILALTTLVGQPRRTSDTDIVGFYSAVTGYNAGDPNSDQGAMIEDVLAAWHAHGIGTKPIDMLDGYATIDIHNHDRVREAVAALGPVDIGVSLPSGWEQATVWDTSTAGTEIAGGHCVTVVGYTEAGPLIVSWGQVFSLTWAGWDAYATEAHALLSQDALTRAGKDVAGVDWDGLSAMMTVIRDAA